MYDSDKHCIMLFINITCTILKTFFFFCEKKQLSKFGKSTKKIISLFDVPLHPKY